MFPSGDNDEFQEHIPSIDEQEDFGDVFPSCPAAFDYAHGKLGIAYYNADTKELFLASDVNVRPPFDHWKSALMQIHPDKTFVSSRVVDILDNSINHDINLGIHELRPRSEFSATNAWGRLAALLMDDVEAQPRLLLRAGRDIEESRLTEAKLKLAGHIDETAKLSLGCVNVLLCLIDRQREVGTIRNLEFLKTMIGWFGMFLLQQTMLLNADTFYSLKIFEDEKEIRVKQAHASTQSKKPDSTLFSILNSCHTISGKALMKHWFFNPSTDLTLLRSRYDAISCFILPVNAQQVLRMTQLSRKCLNMRRSIENLQQGQYGSCRASVWQGILNFAFNSIKLCELCNQMYGADGVQVLERLLAAMNIEALQAIGSLINDVIDFDESVAEERIVVKRLVDEELDEHKDVYEGLEQVLYKICMEVSQTMPADYASFLQCVYLPQLGFLIVMPVLLDGPLAETSSSMPMWQGNDWIVHFSTAESVYFKNPRMKELDEYFGDLHSLVVDREIELLHQLQIRVLEHSKTLIKVSDILAELDCLLAFARAASRYGYVRPIMTEQCVLDIKRGRHPMFSIMTDIFIPNDTLCTAGSASETSKDSEHLETPNLVLLSGANYSGKSVYLVQTALIVYMAHIGSFVPAYSAVIGRTDRILTRLESRDTVAKAESTFLHDLQQVATALDLMTPASLLVIDEFGKGTDATDGAAMFGALVQHLTNPEHVRPRSLLATHFHEVLRSDFLPRWSTSFALKHMAILLGKSDTDTMTYLYELRDGPGLSSYGINCAAIGGMPREVLERAEELLAISARGDSLMDTLSILTKEQQQELEQAENVVAKFLAWDVANEPAENLRTKLAELVLA